jgi:hypothetical protein
MSIDEQWDQSDQSGLVGKVAAGRYLIVAELSGDGRRTLYEAEDVEQGTRVSLGVLHAGTATNDGAIARSLKHPNLAGVLDVGRLDSGEPFLTTEMVRGTSLRALIKRGQLEQRRALSIVRQVLQALTAAHEVGAIHGDVKPENVMVSIDPRGVEHATLLDLGVAMLSGSVLGDPRYGAPEGATGHVDPRADLYSVGAVLFELLTDRPPFWGDDATALTRMHAYAPVQTLQQRAPERHYTAEQEELVARALAKKPDDRFRSAVDMIVALDAAVKAMPAAAMPERPTQPQVDESLALLAKDLMAVTPRNSDPVIPMNTSRQVRELPWHTRMVELGGRLVGRARRLGQKVVEPVRKLDRKHRLIVAAIGGVLVVGLVIAVVVVWSGRTRTTAAVKPDGDAHDSQLASRARSLLAAGQPKQAVELINRELAGHPDDGAAYLILGHAQIALHHARDGLAAYDHAIGLAQTLANDTTLVANVKQVVLTSRDPATAIPALELLSSNKTAPAEDAIVAQTSNAVAEIRHQAIAIAERDGIADRIDWVSSWALDLRQAKTCDERREIITKLADKGDQRALPALRQARAYKCGKREATAAIQTINAAVKAH